jgi:hypothetical protein
LKLQGFPITILTPFVICWRATKPDLESTDMLLYLGRTSPTRTLHYGTSGPIGGGTPPNNGG